MEMDIESMYKLVTDKLQNWLNDFVEMLPNLVAALLIVIAFYFISKFAGRTVNKMLNKVGVHGSLSRFIQNLIQLSVMIFGVFIALGVLDLDKTVTSLLAGVGVIGLALGFAFQDTAANFVAGVFLAFKSPFKLDDVVQTGDVMGKVMHVSMRATEIQTFQGTLVIVPNKDVFQNAIYNYTKSGKRRVDLTCGISYGDDLDKVKEVSKRAMLSISTILPDEGIGFFYNGFGDSSINFVLTAWSSSVKQGDYLEAQSDMIVALKKAFDTNDIMIPFPIRTLDFGIRGGSPLAPEMVQVVKDQMG